jgi:hypothetical protein
MRKFMPIAVIAWLFAGAAAAADSDALVDAFKRICYDGKADPDKVRAALDASWTEKPVPPESAKQYTAFFEREKVEGSSKWGVFVAQGDLPPGDVPFPTRIQVCLVSREPDEGAHEAALGALVGGEPSESNADGTGWIYFDGPKRQFLKPPVNAPKLMADDPFVIVLQTHNPRGSALGYTHVEKITK